MKTITDQNPESLKPLFILLFVILILWSITAVGLIYYFKSWSIQGQFGDMFGAINSLFSGFAFAGIIYTIFLQRKELSLQRMELIETRKELARTASAQEKSESALRKQAKNLEISAKLEALNSLVNYYTDLEKRLHDIRSIELGDFGRKRDNYLKRIEKIVDKEEDY